MAAVSGASEGQEVGCVGERLSRYGYRSLGKLTCGCGRRFARDIKSA